MILSLQVYRLRDGQWRWRMRASNRLIIGAATESYKTRAKAVKNLRAVTGFMVGPARYQRGNWQVRITAYSRGWGGCL